MKYARQTQEGRLDLLNIQLLILCLLVGGKSLMVTDIRRISSLMLTHQTGTVNQRPSSFTKEKSRRGEGRLGLRRGSSKRLVLLSGLTLKQPRRKLTSNHKCLSSGAIPGGCYWQVVMKPTQLERVYKLNLHQAKLFFF